MSGPGWLAATGATLLLVAAVVVVAGQWSAIGPTARFAGLVGALFATFFAAEALRVRIPTTATSLAVLAACVTAPVGIAAVAALGGRWPLCIAVGGGAALLACELQSRRWEVRTLEAATVAATLVSLAGISAITAVPAAVLCAIASALALVAGATRRSLALAAVVPLAPAAWILAELDVGPGVLVRMGVVDVDAWVVPISTLIAGFVIAVSGHRTRRSDVAAAALVVLAYSAIAALVQTSAPLSVWLSAPGAIAVLIASAGLGDQWSIFSSWARSTRSVAATILAFASWAAPVLVVLIRFGDTATLTAISGQLLLPAIVTLGAMLVLAATVDSTSLLDDVVRLGCIGWFVTVVATADITVEWVACAALATWVITTAATSWRTWIATSALHSTWAAAAVLTSDATPPVASTIIVLAAVAVITACCATRNTGLARAVMPAPVAVGVVLLAAQWPEELGALAAVIAVAAVASTGIAMLRRGVTPGDSLALSLGSSAAIVSLGSTPAGVSLGVTLFAAQLWLYGVAFRRTPVATAAAVTASFAVLSLWWTTGTNDFVIDRIAPFGADGQDVALGAVSLALIGAGVALRRVQRPSTWLAYSPGLSLAFAWLLLTQADVAADWPTFAGLVVDVVAVGVGGARRLAAPLVIGTVGLIGTGVISIGDRLATAPTWTWIAIGGTGLLAIAGLLERVERPLLPGRPSTTREDDDESPAAPAASLAEAFTRAFE